jgi:biopolymer transport protein ExbD
MPKLEPIPSGRAAGGRRGRASRVSTSLAEINVVPLVDVMLVLLVIFMVAAPMMKQGFPVRLPQAKKAPSINGPVTVTIPLSFRKDRQVQVDGAWVKLDNLDERAKQALASHAEKTVIVAGDTGIQLGDVVAVFGQLNAGGISNVQLQSQPQLQQPATQ